MYKLFALGLACCYVLSLNAQQEPGWRQNIPSSFRYGKELNNCIFIPGGTQWTGVFEGTDSNNHSVPQQYAYSAFHIWKYETSNQEYRAFVQWVVDSVCRERLGYYQWVQSKKQMDRSRLVDINDERLAPLLASADNRIFNKRMLDMTLFYYRLPGGDSVAVYPDTTAWLRDKPYRYCEPMGIWYFAHPAFKKYPVSCVSYTQALAYCDWKTKQWNEALLAAGNTTHEFLFRLPTAMEWEVAATDIPAHESKKGILYHFPIMNKEKTAYLYNFGQVYDQKGFLIKDYTSMNNYYTEPVLKGTESKRGLYHMHGNVAEWTATSANGQQIVKGGSWASAAFYLQPAVNEYYSPGAQHAFTGFRLAIEFREKPVLSGNNISKE